MNYTLFAIACYIVMRGLQVLFAEYAPENMVQDRHQIGYRNHALRRPCQSGGLVSEDPVPRF
jgi:hypothetical protein